MNSTEKSLLFTAEDIARQVQRLARQISEDYQGREVIVVGVLKGAFIFLADLVRLLTIPTKLDFVRLSSYGAGTESSGHIKIAADVKIDLHGQDIIIVEDIVDTGLTTAFLYQHLLTKKPRSLRICTLLNKTERRSIEIPLEYVGLHLDKGFVVGYGLDFNETGRHLPDIYELIL